MLSHKKQKSNTRKDKNKMKKFSIAKILSLVCLCALLFGAFAFAVSATEDDKVEIVAANVYYGDVYQIMYAVNAPEGTTLKATDSKGNEIKVVPFTEAPTANINGVDCKVYILETGVAAQAIDEVITLTAEYGNKKAVKNYSILQYIYERCQVVEGAELEMLEALLAYAVKADVFFNGTTESFDKYQYVAATGVTTNGANIKGMYAPGATPFANIDAIEYDAEKYELVVTVNGVASTLDALKALVVADEAIAVNVEIAEIDLGHTHVYTKVVTEPTCYTAGFTTYTCECEDTYTADNVPSTGEHIDNDNNYKCDTVGCKELILPENNSTITIAEALKIGALYASNEYTENSYYISGTITDVYNTQYGNMYITDGTNIITVYGLYEDGVRYDAMTDKPSKYDAITIYGPVGQYGGTPQFKNAELIEFTEHECSEYTNATCEKLAECVVCGEKIGELAEHNMVDGVCTVCGHEEGAAEIVTETATLKYSTATTTNMTGNNDASKLGLDATIFSVVGNKGGTNNNCGLNKAGQIRLYGSSSNGNGSYFTVTSAEGYTIKSIKITFTNTTNNKNCQLTVGDDSTVFAGASTTWEVEINANSFTLKNVVKGSTTQIYIASIEITYVVPAAE